MEDRLKHYERIPLTPQLKDNGFNRMNANGDDYSKERIIGVCVNYEDNGGVWQFLYPSLIQRLPLRGITWKNHLQATKSIDRLNVNFQQILPPGKGQNLHSDTNGLVNLFIVKCEDLETYKTKTKPALTAWVDRMSLNKCEWLVLYVPLGTQAPASSASRGLTAFSQSFRDSTKVYRKIYERMKSDFTERSEKSKMDRICKVEVLEGSSVQGAVPGQQQQHESQWSEILIKLKTCIMDAFDARCSEYEEQIRLLDGRRSLSGWDFSSYIQVKESLAMLYIQATLFDDALRHYEELDAIFSSTLDHTDKIQFEIDKSDPILTSTPFDLDMTSIRMNIAVNNASSLYIRLYLFCRQIAILYLMDAYAQVCDRGLEFIPQFVSLLQRGDLPSNLPLRWAIGAALALCVSCEHESTTREHPTTPTLAKFFGELIYLARRNCHSLIKLPRNVSSDDSWYHTFQSESVLFELTSLSAKYFALAGRCRFAAYLGGQCAIQLAREKDYKGAASLFLTQMQQYEKDEWWELMHASISQVIQTEIKGENYQEALELCTYWMKLTAAGKLDSTEINSIWRNLLIQSHSKQDQLRVIWSHIFEPAVRIIQATPTHVAISLQVKNHLEVDIVINRYRIIFSNDRGRSTTEDCLDLNVLQVGDNAVNTKLQRSTTKETIDSIDDFTSYLSSDLSTSIPSTKLPQPLMSIDNMTSIALKSHGETHLEALSTPGDLFSVGKYTCDYVELYIDTYCMSIPFDDPHCFNIDPGQISTLTTKLECPQLFLPTSVADIKFVIESNDDAVQGGELILSCENALNVIMRTSPDASEQMDGKVLRIQLQEIQKRHECVVSVITSENCGPLAIDASFEYTYIAGQHPEKATRVVQINRNVYPLVDLRFKSKRFGTKTYLQMELQCNQWMGIRFDPKLLGFYLQSEDESVDILSQNHSRIKVLTNPNTKLSIVTLSTSETFHTYFVVEMADDISSRMFLRLNYTSNDDNQLGKNSAFYDLPIQIANDDRQDDDVIDVKAAPNLLVSTYRRNEWIVFDVHIVSKCHDEKRLRIELDEETRRFWLCAGRAIQTVQESINFKLRARFLGRLPLPTFKITTGDSKSLLSLNVRHVTPLPFVLVVSD